MGNEPIDDADTSLEEMGDGLEGDDLDVEETGKEAGKQPGAEGELSVEELAAREQ
jgi:hypothetical protein